MRLHSLKISGFRRVKKAEIKFGDTTFLIGSNNIGKSSTLHAIEILLSAKKQLNSSDYFSEIDPENGETKIAIDTIILEAEFRNLPKESVNWRGFKGRIFNYESDDETGLSITYKKTYPIGKDVIIEFKSKEREISTKYIDLKKPIEFIENGIDRDIIIELFGEENLDKKLTANNLIKLEDLDEIWTLNEEETWFKNPGGIPGNVLKMLPRFLFIPAETSINEIDGSTSGVLNKTLNELFNDVRDSSINFNEAQKFLSLLEKELDPQDESSKFGQMMSELNEIMSSVFPETKFYASADLSDPKVLKPNFKVEMSSNIRTSVNLQGTGMVRSAAFAMLRYRQQLVSQKEDNFNRSLIICFEEPEIFLHPSAAIQMRDAIYDLSSNDSQIVATTHSPFLIDISKKPRQILNRLFIDIDNELKCLAFNVTDAFLSLQKDDKTYVKMILKIDDYISKIFFTKNVVIIEGDTEEILIKESLKRLDKDQYLKIVSSFEIIKARGKQTIIGLVKYLTSMGINPIIVHDRDNNTPGAFLFNKPIEEALNSNGKIILMEENVEDVLGYSASYEKPFKAFLETEKWGDKWEDLPEKWRLKLIDIFHPYIS